MTTTEKNIYQHIAHHMYDEADAVRVGDEKASGAVATIAYQLIELFDEKYVNGFMLEIKLWMGLKDDAPDMAKGYEKGIKQAWPEAFETDATSHNPDKNAITTN